MEKHKSSLSFSDIAAELDMPEFSEDETDPLTILTHLPISTYLTTSHEDFLQRALILNRDLRGENADIIDMCDWHRSSVENVALSFEPTLTRPLVYHLYGHLQKPESLVVSEDDYAEFVWALANKRNAGTKQYADQTIIPEELIGKLRGATILLLGYRTTDLDFRTLFRSLLASGLGIGRKNRSHNSLAVLLNPSQETKVLYQESAENYLKAYFRQANFQVMWGDTNQFLANLWQTWQGLYSAGDG